MAGAAKGIVVDDGLDPTEEAEEVVPAVTGRLAVQIRRARERKGLSQRNLAEMAGINRETLRRIEAGQHDPRWSVGVQLARLLDLPVQPDFFAKIAYGQVGAHRVQGE